MPSDSTVAATATATTSEHHVPRPLLRTGHRSFSVKASMLPPTPPNASLRHTTSRSHRKRAHSLGTTTSTLVRSASASGQLYKLEHYHVAMESKKSSSSPSATTTTMPPQGKSRVTPSKPSAPCSWSQEQLRALDVDRIGDVWQPMQIRRSLRRSVLQRNAVRVLASQVAAMNSGTRPRPSSTSSSASSSSSGGAGAGAGAGADTEQAPGAGTRLRRTYSVESTGSSLSITSTASTSVESVCSVASDAHVSVIDSVDVLVANTINTNTNTSTSSPRSTHA